MSGSDVKTFGWPGVGFLLLINLIAASLFFSPGMGDVGTWGTWIREMSAFGLVGGFVHSGTDYPPLALIILATVSRSADVFRTTVFLSLKCSLLIFLTATAATFYWFSRNLILTAVLRFCLRSPICACSAAFCCTLSKSDNVRLKFWQSRKPQPSDAAS